MKFSLIAAAGALAAASQVSALAVITPWASTVWTAGGHGEITWKVEAADAGKKCDIYLLNGDFKNSNIVAQVTDPATPVDCSVAKYDMHPLNDFAAGEYWIRIGQASTGTWAYSSPFKFEGKGTAKPISVVGVTNPSPAAGNGTAPVAPVTGSPLPSGAAPAAAKPSGTASPAANGAQSKSAAASTSPSPTSAASSSSVNSAAVALGAIAAVAFAL